MSATDLPFALGALALFFFVPGYLLMKALWPEKRWSGPERTTVAVEMVTGGFVSSLGIFLLVGFFLGNVGAFWASPSDPLVEEVLGGIALGLFGAGWFRGAYAKDPPPVPSYVEPPSPGEEDLEPVLQSFQALVRDEERMERQIRRRRRAGAPRAELEPLEEELHRLQDVRRKAEREREASFDG